jgi:hypothetical protein
MNPYKFKRFSATLERGSLIRYPQLPRYAALFTSSSEAEERDRDLPAEQDCIHIILPRRCCSSLSWNHTYDVAAHFVADENNQ